ncbi:MAG: hypothetical protein ABIH89_10065 [Elusimicrobiota bacterium]
MEKKWKLKIGEKTYNPAETEKIRAIIEKGNVPETAQVAEAGTGEYKRIFETDEFKDFFKVKINDKSYGPYAAKTIARLIKAKKVTSAALIAHPLKPGQWHQIIKIKAFSSLFESLNKALKCPQCGAQNTGSSTACVLCNSPLKEEPQETASKIPGGMVQEAGINKPQAPAAATPSESEEPAEEKYTEQPFFYVSVKRLILFTLLTLGVYEVYWFYKQWSFVKHHIRPGIKPFWRALFSIFFCQGLFKTVKEYSFSKKLYPKFNPELMALIFVVLSFCWRLPDYYSVISLLAIIPVLIVQKAINELVVDYEKETGINVRSVRKKKSKLFIVLIICIAGLVGIIGGVIAIYVVQFNKDVTVETLRTHNIGDIDMSISLPGIPVEDKTGIIDNMDEPVISKKNYSVMIKMLEIRISHAEFAGEVSPETVFEAITAWISTIEGLSNMEIKHNEFEIEDFTGTAYSGSFNRNDINVMTKGAVFIRGSEVWTLAMFYDSSNENMDTVCREIIASIKISKSDKK